MTDKTKINSETTQSKSAENRAVFGPLGKYAVIAVLMVSIIVTTAIMLDRQLNTVEHQIASFENKVAELHTAKSDTDELATVASQDTTETETTTAEAQITAAVTGTQIKSVISTTATIAPATTVDTSEQIAEVVTSEMTIDSDAARLQNIAANNARIESYKVEQKQRTAEMFERIKALEAQQLDRYKLQQDQQIAKLNEQIAQQQKMIEALVTRNENLFELRAANIQRNQANREEILNRI